MQKLLKLTTTDYEPILIGVESIISVEIFVLTNTQGKKTLCSKIFSRAAMATSYYVKETIEEIYEQYNK
jgi:hypothetical protein